MAVARVRICEASTLGTIGRRTVRLDLSHRAQSEPILGNPRTRRHLRARLHPAKLVNRLPQDTCHRQVERQRRCSARQCYFWVTRAGRALGRAGWHQLRERINRLTSAELRAGTIAILAARKSGGAAGGGEVGARHLVAGPMMGRRLMLRGIGASRGGLLSRVLSAGG